MKKKEPVGDDDTLPEEITGKLDSLAAEDLRVGVGLDRPQGGCRVRQSSGWV